MVGKRRAFFSATDIFAEAATVLAHRERDDIDWITFVGSGETTLNSRLGSLIRLVKSLSSHPVAVITNGSLLHLPRVREELSAADAVLPSLDAGTEELYYKINRPQRDLSFQRHVDGLVEFRKTFHGRLWVEVMLLGGINDLPDALRDIAAVLQGVEPDEIHLSTPTRPPAELWVRPPSPGRLERAASILGRVTKVLRPVSIDGEASIDGDLASAVTRIISRHPLQEVELERMLTRWVQGRVDTIVAALVEGGEIQVVERLGKRFWCASDMAFPDETSARTSLLVS
jgi:wyosine [tRNA(Phe)-imidazoG37] synthetase (radical SAM superfamily)